MPSITMEDYAKIFQMRGSAYDRAMLAYPHARQEEFAQLLEPLDLQAGMAIGDVPAGGGYLRRYIPDHCTWLGHEPCSEFSGHHVGDQGKEQDLLPLPWGDATLGAVVSLAGVHHVNDKVSLFDEVHRVTIPGGIFVLSDVAEGSTPALFLDGFVGRWNSTGHQGDFLNEGTLDELKAAGWSILDKRINRFFWRFQDRSGLSDFTRQLFDIQRASHTEIETAIENDLGIVDLPGGGVGMNWSLMTITCRKREADRGE